MFSGLPGTPPPPPASLALEGSAYCSAKLRPLAHHSSTRKARSVFQRLGDVHFEMDVAHVRVLKPPAPVRILLLQDQMDCLIDSLIGFNPGAAQVVQTSEDIVVPPGRKRKTKPRRVDQFPG